jgi:hypothetical protein
LETLGYVTAVVGSGGVGKSYLLLWLGIAALVGLRWLGVPVAKVRSVLYVDAELDLDTQKERGWQIARGLGLRRPPGPCRWWQLPWAWIRPWGLHYHQLGHSLATEEGQEELARAAERCRAGLVLLDSLTIGAGGAGLSDPNAWNAVLSGLEALGVPVVVIDHTPASGEKMVGSFMKQAKVRSMLLLSIDTRSGVVTAGHGKSNFGPMRGEIRFRPVFQHFEPGAAAKPLVRFDVVDAEGQPVPPTGEPAGPGKRWTMRERLVLDAYTARGRAGAVPKEIAEELGPALGARAEADVREATKKLAGAQPPALVPVGKVAPRGPNGGRPAVRYVAAGLDAGVDAVAQAEALLRERSPHPGGAGGTAG